MSVARSLSVRGIELANDADYSAHGKPTTERYGLTRREAADLKRREALAERPAQNLPSAGK